MAAMYTLAVAATRLQDDIWYGGGKDGRTTMPLMADQKFGLEARRELEMFFEQAICPDSLVIALVDVRNLLAMLDALVEIHGTACDGLPVLNTQELVAGLGS